MRQNTAGQTTHEHTVSFMSVLPEPRAIHSPLHTSSIKSGLAKTRRASSRLCGNASFTVVQVRYKTSHVHYTSSTQFTTVTTHAPRNLQTAKHFAASMLPMPHPPQLPILPTAYHHVDEHLMGAIRFIIFISRIACPTSLDAIAEGGSHPCFFPFSSCMFWGRISLSDRNRWMSTGTSAVWKKSEQVDETGTLSPEAALSDLGTSEMVIEG